jgi:hypothetical protein
MPAARPRTTLAAMLLAPSFVGGCSLFTELLLDEDEVPSPTVACAVAADCPGVDTTCRARVCADGACGVENAPAGLTCPGAPLGQCDGRGACVTTDACLDGELGGDESDVDCGGACPPCALGGRCATAGDCVSAHCEGGVCTACGPDDCESGAYCDPGGSGVCLPQSLAGEPCETAGACVTGFCVDGVCCGGACDGGCERCDAPETGGTCAPEEVGTSDPSSGCGDDVCGVSGACRCADGTVNGQETDVDCGGDVCDRCVDGSACVEDADCENDVCSGSECQVPACGDGKVNGADECDGDGEGTAGETPTCDVDCTAPACGDGVLNNAFGEACDGDGMGEGGETLTCDVDCTFQLCGDGTVNTTAGETCDGDGAGMGGETSTCDVDCTAALCGDGRINVTRGEQCDGNSFGTGGETASCDVDCTLASCGDGTVNATRGEECDDGDPSGYDGCAASCQTSAPHLLISEVAIAPAAAAFVELYNPTETTVDLSTVWVADSPDYYLVTVGGGAPGASDFRARFPDGATLPPGGFVVVAIGSATNFFASYAALPDFDLDAADASAPSLVGSSASTSALEAAESLVVFAWDGATELVTDVDYLSYGDASGAVDKSGITVGASTYADDTAAALQSVAPSPSTGATLHRCDTAEASETTSGGNGQFGHDETSEDVAASFVTSAIASPSAPPPPGACSG